ncbi:MAG: Gfo/Idh/MocA family oxidoreductase, partial [Evtepia sp.]
IYDGYEALLADESIDAVYIPLPPALHFEWGKKVLESGKHILMEKPFTMSLADTKELLKIAEENRLAVHEDYMFVYHSQLSAVEKLVADGEIGELRLIRTAFGFPKRAATDFRYNKALGGGALLDCGGYPVRLAAHLLGETAQIVASSLQYSPEFEVDIGGSATMKNDAGQVAQIAFGMDNSYKCELELWGSTGSVYTNRIYTAPVDFEPQVVLKKGNNERLVSLPADDSFQNSIDVFRDCIRKESRRAENSAAIERQATQMDRFLRGAGK